MIPTYQLQVPHYQKLKIGLTMALHNVNAWLNTNKLTLNTEKTEFMLIASKGKLKQLTDNPNINIGNHNIKQVSKKKVLGMIIDEELKWKEHNDVQ